MELSYWWMLPLAAAAVVISAWLYHRRRTPQTRPIAHGDRLTALPEYQDALRRHRRRLLCAVILGAVFLGATATAAARPLTRTSEVPEIRNRDIVLCLDVSGSMTSTDAAIAKVFQELAKEFDGERIGMVIFDSSSVQLFPLTDDYDYAAQQLSEAREALDSGAGSFFDGTWNGAGSSLIGDGLASCVQSFPEDTASADPQRSRSVVLATDNFLSGEPIFTLDEAAALAVAKNVKVYAMNPNDLDYGKQADEPGTQLRAAAERTEGAYYTVDSADAVAGIVGKVQESEATSYLAAPQAVVADAPAWPLGIALLAGTGMLVLGRRMEP
ncbi:vWA domain-containing protein [Paenarthrobacter nicotinovorans]|uniref:vWA domain-containing protein n=1 Tax=Paenarthrobacter nicotinovorans TaxID=29320 RepID=UPI00047ADE18|nr:vWA domain-containing protein [Paenarthrobacter nicotinovorans]